MINRRVGSQDVPEAIADLYQKAVTSSGCTREMYNEAHKLVTENMRRIDMARYIEIKLSLLTVSKWAIPAFIASGLVMYFCGSRIQKSRIYAIPMSIAGCGSLVSMMIQVPMTILYVMAFFKTFD